MQTLPEFISKVGDAEFAKAFGYPIRTVQSWRRRERYPRHKAARRLVQLSGGELTLHGVYADGPRLAAQEARATDA